MQVGREGDYDSLLLQETRETKSLLEEQRREAGMQYSN